MTGEPEKEGTDPAVRKIRAHAPIVIRIALAVAACVPAFVSYLGASSEAESKAKVAKDEATDQATATYQVAVPELERLRAAVGRLEGEVTVLKRAVRAIGKRTSISVTVNPSPAPTVSPPLPATLEKAVEQARAAEPAKP